MNSLIDLELNHTYNSKNEIYNNRRCQSRRVSDEMFRLLVENMNEGVIIINTDSVIIFVNDQFCNMLGYHDDDLLGQSVESIIDNSSKDELMQNILYCISKDASTNTFSQAINIQWLSNDGNIIFSRISPQIIDDTEYQDNLFFALVTNITESKKAQEALVQTQKELHLLSDKLLTSQEIERKRIAGELHDGIGQCLNAVRFKIEELIETAVIESTGFEALKALIPLLQNATTEVRRIAMDLRPSILDDLGLKATITWFSREFRTIFPLIDLEVSIEVEEDEISDQLKTVLYRIIQESLNNITKHAEATHVMVRLNKKQDHLHLNIQDNGIGLVNANDSNATDNIGFGLSSMKERVELTVGTFNIKTETGQGVAIQACWPWKPPQ